MFGANHVIVFCICIEFHENIFDGLKVIEWTDLHIDNFKGANSAKTSVDL